MGMESPQADTPNRLLKSFHNYGVGEGVSVGAAVGDGMGVGGAVTETEMVMGTVPLLGSLLEMVIVAL